MAMARQFAELPKLDRRDAKSTSGILIYPILPM